MSSEECWLGISDTAPHRSAANDLICHLVDSRDFPAHRVERLSLLSALGGGRMGESGRVNPAPGEPQGFIINAAP